MLNKSICILNFDNALIRQKNLLSRYKTEIIDLESFASEARLWMDRKTKEEIERSISGSSRGAATFFGSGDYHHISSILIGQFSQPISVIVFDFHPDWDNLPPKLACGSWVSRILENHNVKKCILTGVSSSDISSGSLQSANLASLKNDRVEIYPYRHKPSSVFFKRVPGNACLRVERRLFLNRIYWNELRGKNLGEFFLSVLKRIPTKDVYVSIDKDCLKKEYALTNWEEGYLSLEELMLMLGLIKENLNIIGADITGDYSNIDIKNKFKDFLSRLDHPKGLAADTMPEDIITATNEETNLRLLNLLIS